MQEKKLVEEMEEASTKLDIAIEAGGRGDWPRAEPCIAEAKRILARILLAVERLNDIEKLTGHKH
jgi:hypothetical protein